MVQGTRVTNADLYEKIGRLLEGQDHAREGRKVIHERLDDMAKGVSDLTQAVANQSHVLSVNAGTTAQLRTAVEGMRAELDTDIKPALAAVTTFKDDSTPLVNSIRNARNAMIVMGALLAASGLTVGGTLVFANDFAKETVRSWLNDVSDELPPTR